MKPPKVVLPLTNSDRNHYHMNYIIDFFFFFSFNKLHAILYFSTSFEKLEITSLKKAAIRSDTCLDSRREEDPLWVLSFFPVCQAWLHYYIACKKSKVLIHGLCFCALLLLWCQRVCRQFVCCCCCCRSVSRSQACSFSKKQLNKFS